MNRQVKNPYNIQIQWEKMGKDYAFLITGGTAHIGASAIAYYENNGQIKVEGIQVPGHREGPLTEELANLAAKRLKSTVAVMMGIHIDHATKEMIEEIVNNVQEAMSSQLDAIMARTNS